MKKTISMILAFTLLLTSTVTLSINATEIDSKGFMGYMEGVPITKNDINEHGLIINEEKLKLIEEKMNSKPYYPSKKIYVSEGTSVLVEKELSNKSARWDQTTYVNYFTPKSGRKFASKISIGTLETIAWGLAGIFKAPYGAMITVAGVIRSLYMNELAGDIRK